MSAHFMRQRDDESEKARMNSVAKLRDIRDQQLRIAAATDMTRPAMRQAAAETAQEIDTFIRLAPDEQGSDIPALRAKMERLRTTLEQRSVVLIGPRSPFWKCQYCQAAATSPLMFKHNTDCILGD